VLAIRQSLMDVHFDIKCAKLRETTAVIQTQGLCSPDLYPPQHPTDTQYGRKRRKRTRWDTDNRLPQSSSPVTISESVQPASALESTKHQPATDREHIVLSDPDSERNGVETPSRTPSVTSHKAEERSTDDTATSTRSPEKIARKSTEKRDFWKNKSKTKPPWSHRQPLVRTIWNQPHGVWNTPGNWTRGSHYELRPSMWRTYNPTYYTYPSY
jgi:hypothetical protein